MAQAADEGEVAILRDGAAVAVPGGVQAADDLYLWNGQEWVFLPSLVSGDGQQLQILEAPAGQDLRLIDTWLMSTMMPRRFNSVMTSAPNSLMPFHLRVSSYDESDR